MRLQPLTPIHFALEWVVSASQWPVLKWRVFSWGAVVAAPLIICTVHALQLSSKVVKNRTTLLEWKLEFFFIFLKFRIQTQNNWLKKKLVKSFPRGDLRCFLFPLWYYMGFISASASSPKKITIKLFMFFTGSSSNKVKSSTIIQNSEKKRVVSRRSKALNDSATTSLKSS